jgi:hypothetical protein
MGVAASRRLDDDLVAPDDIYVYRALFAVFRGDAYCLRLATFVANSGRHEAGCDLTNGAFGISRISI